jgi:CheY-like chemotaxis protein
MQKRLLVIDDSKRFATTLSRMASDVGYTAMPCTDPQQALDVFLSFRPDVVMIDLCLPEKDGLEVADEILLTGRPVGVIFTSGYGTGFLQAAADVARFHDHGKVAMLGKPFRRYQFAEALDKVNPARNDSEAEELMQA